MNSYYKELPDVFDLRRLKGEIARLADREYELVGETRSEYHRQLVDIRNLYRLVRSEVLESKNQVALPLATHHADLLRKNWGRMKASILIAESYSG